MNGKLHAALTILNSVDIISNDGLKKLAAVDPSRRKRRTVRRKSETGNNTGKHLAKIGLEERGSLQKANGKRVVMIYSPSQFFA